MIAYLDTSAIVPLLVDEPASSVATRVWRDADQLLSSRVAYVEVASALAASRRRGLTTRAIFRLARRVFDGVWDRVAVVELDDRLARDAAHDAERFNLRGYDAVHCASARSSNSEDLVAVSGDRALLAAWQAAGIATIDTLG